MTTAIHSRFSRWLTTLPNTAIGKEGHSYDTLFILLNRNNSTPMPAHDYDIVIGPIANDRVGVQLWKYETQAIDLPTLVHNLRNMKGITFQYYFGTDRAIKILKRL